MVMHSSFRCSLALVLVAFAAAQAREPTDKKVPAELQGVWKLESLEVDGEKVDLRSLPRLSIKGDKVQYGGEELGTLTADATTTPKILDLSFLKPDKKNYEAIYSIEKNTLKICINGSSTGVKERPADFTTKDKLQLRLLTFQRDVTKDPDLMDGVPAFAGVALKVEDGKVTVVNVIADSPAKKSGLEKDDLVLKIGNAEPADLKSAVEAVRQAKPARDLIFRVKRGDKEMDITVKPAVVPFALLIQLE
jgi:uncharacterized protein (TIGR03067 family)